ncbi:hypothetical protein LCGC14_2190440 [marine sediment metagenome]|uniref:Uncharacterized protein n=1 Tax=marine sediment metagenome TaxID=412755 RepID=A0A0F9DJW9_9ZZZZ
MAEIRMVNTMVWQDRFFEELRDGRRNIYLYLLSNTHISYYGVMKVSPDMIAGDMRCKVADVEEALDDFEEEGVITRFAPYWIVVNVYPAHQSTGKAQLNKKSINALRANKFEMPADVLALVLKMWDITEEDIQADAPSDGASDGALNKREEERGKRKEKTGKVEGENTDDDNSPPDPPSAVPAPDDDNSNDNSNSTVRDLLCEAYGHTFYGKKDWRPEDAKDKERLATAAGRIKFDGDIEKLKRGLAFVMLAAKRYEKANLPDGKFELYNLISPKFLTYRQRLATGDDNPGIAVVWMEVKKIWTRTTG